MLLASPDFHPIILLQLSHGTFVDGGRATRPRRRWSDGLLVYGGGKTTPRRLWLGGLFLWRSRDGTSSSAAARPLGKDASIELLDLWRCTTSRRRTVVWYGYSGVDSRDMSVEDSSDHDECEMNTTT